MRRSQQATQNEKEIQMKARASILTIATSLALVAPAAHAAGAAGTALGCGSRAKHTAVQGTRFADIPSRGSRALQLAVIGDGAATSQPLQTLCGAKITAAVAPNHFQVLRDSL
jgi:hypothetical protein